MKLDQILKRNGESYKVYKITEFEIFAESLDHINIICIQRPNYLQLVK